MRAHSSHARSACESLIPADLRRSASKFGWLQRVGTGIPPRAHANGRARAAVLPITAPRADKLFGDDVRAESP